MREKSVHGLVLDEAPLIKLCQSELRALKADSYCTVQGVVDEIRDKDSRQAFDLWRDSIDIKKPTTEQIKKVVEFAKLTGDYAVLSTVDIQMLALARELECQLNNGDWRLRDEPGQKLKKKKKKKCEATKAENKNPTSQEIDGISDESTANLKLSEDISCINNPPECLENFQVESTLSHTVHDIIDSKDSDCESDGWITPLNIKSRRGLDTDSFKFKTKTILKVSIVSQDFAVQNVALQMGLNLTNLHDGMRIRNISTWILRCHACANIKRDTNKKFCSKCGGPTLMRTSCSTDVDGTFRIYLKQNMQWNNRGTIYNIPKPKHGTSSGKGESNVILCEDQREYEKLIKHETRLKSKDLFDPDNEIVLGSRMKKKYGILIGLGRNVNVSRKSR